MPRQQRLPDKNQRHRRFCFTWNNYPLDAEDQLRCFFERKAGEYLVVGREKGESGTPHLQGYICLKHGIAFTALKKHFPQIHLERAKGTPKQNQDYCTKDGDFFEVGEVPEETGKSGGEASRETWRNILSAAESGNWDYLKREYPRVWTTMSEKLISKRVPRTTVIDGETQNEWWYGETGTGKSRLAWEKYGTICYQKMLNKWWDGYDDQPVVIIEEWSPKNEVTASALKIWADRYPFTAQIKGGVLQKIRPTKIIVISNYRLNDCFPDTRDGDPIARRFKQFEFPKDIGEATQNAVEFVAAHDTVGEPPESTEGLIVDDPEENLGDLADILAGLGQDTDWAGPGGQGWVDYVTPADFDRFFLASD